MTDTTDLAPGDPHSMDLEQERAELIRALNAYQNRQMRLSLIGPALSLGLHVLILLLMQAMIVNKTKEPERRVTVQLIEREVKELEPEIIDEWEKEHDEAAPDTVEVPEVSVEVVDQPMEPTDSASPSMELQDVSAALNHAAGAEDFGDAANADVLSALESSETPLKLAGLSLPVAFQGRATESSRAAGRTRFGGSDATERAVLKALRWLRDNQNPDGSWSKTKPEAMTALGLLAFMAHGEGPDSDEFGGTVLRACNRLYDDMMAVSEDNPPLDDYYPYRNGMMTYALAEAYAITRIPMMKMAMEKGLRTIVKRQQPGGGWDYQYCQGARWDITASTWQMQALKAGYTAGSTTPGVAEALERGSAFLRDTAWKDGNFQWVPLYPGDWGVQGGGVLCLQITGYGRSKQAKAIIDRIYDHGEQQFDAIKNRLFWEHNNPYYDWYYETQVMFHAGNATWRRWNKGFSKALLETQHEDGHWQIPGERSQQVEHAAFQTTALNCLSLQIYYRYLPSYQDGTSFARSGSSLVDEVGETSSLHLERTRF